MVINGSKQAKRKLRELKKKYKNPVSLKLRRTSIKTIPQLDIIYVEKNLASETYIRNKKEAAEEIGFKVIVHKFKKDVSAENIRATCNSLNVDPNCTGYFIQLPLPEKFVKENILDAILPDKDVDCLTSTNLGKVLKNRKDAIYPGVVEAMIFMLKELKIRLKFKRVTIVNDSNLIGKPLAGYLLSKGATVTICNEFTKDLARFTCEADVLVTAVGKAKLITEDMVTKGAIVLDAGFSKSKGKVVGDVDFEAVKKKARAISPVPGGVGPLNIACLLENLVKIDKAK